MLLLKRDIMIIDSSCAIFQRLSKLSFWWRVIIPIEWLYILWVPLLAIYLILLILSRSLIKVLIQELIILSLPLESGEFRYISFIFIHRKLERLSLLIVLIYLSLSLVILAIVRGRYLVLNAKLNFRSLWVVLIMVGSSKHLLLLMLLGLLPRVATGNSDGVSGIKLRI